MELQLLLGDVLEQRADVLISTANPWLNMSGGVNGAILERGGEAIQAELHAYLALVDGGSVEPGSVVQTSAGALPFGHILHAVAIDPFYDSSVELVRDTLRTAFGMARTMGAESLSMPALATGYGHLTMESFAEAFAQVVREEWSPLNLVRLVLRSEANANIVRKTLAAGE